VGALAECVFGFNGALDGDALVELLTRLHLGAFVAVAA
jgi:hypothetical protein